jgi:hypothetical protein
MGVIDERGRIFGKINLIDAIVALLVLAALPVAYGAFLLFRVPVPTITSVAPAAVMLHQPTSVQLTGQNFRPFLRAGTGTAELPLFVRSPTEAEIKVPDLPQGSYDVILYDESQELTRKPGALTVVAESAVKLDVQAVGAFVGLTEAAAKQITSGSDFRVAAAAAPIAEVIAVRAPQPGTSRVKIGPNVFATATTSTLRVPAILRIHCSVVSGDCRAADAVIAANASLTLPRQGTDAVQFAIDQVLPAGMHAAFPSTASVRVRFVAGSEILNVIKRGDTDVGGMVTDPDGAVLEDIGSDRQQLVAMTNPEPLLRRNVQVPQTVVAFSGTVRVPVVLTPLGWSYHDHPVKVGGVFNFETASGAMTGWILDVKIRDEAAQ